ncbi:toxin-antitoxin system HicB family antitoxin [Chloroflexi bacterium TSY]|nr:toxin-antitoxin system HicB family antitoxin [Chloroflexi bacterium TSY]
MTTQAATYSLRLPISLKEAVADAAKRDGISMNQFIMLAVAEKLSAMETAHFFAERRERVDMVRFRQILNRSGGEPPQDGDEIPEPS